MWVKVQDPKSCQTLVSSLLQNSDALLHYCCITVSKPQHKSIYSISVNLATWIQLWRNCKNSTLDQRAGTQRGRSGKGWHYSLKSEYIYKGKVAWCRAVQRGTHRLTWLDPEAALSTVRDLRAVLFPCTSSARTKCWHKIADRAVGVNVQFTKHICNLEALTLVRYLTCFLTTCFFACSSDLLRSLISHT